MNPNEIIMMRDRQFCEDCQTGKEKAWASYFLDDGVMVTSGNKENIIGKSNIEKAMKSTYALPKIHFTWTPITCEVSNDGTLAVTRGTSTLRYELDGKEIVSYGNYTTVWKYIHQQWLISWDIGN